MELHRPDPELPYTLQTDGSLEGLGAVLFQTTPSGQRRIISYASATLNATERKYHINEIEALGVIWAIKRYANILQDVHFTLRVDNRSLLWLHKNRDVKTKLTRWSLLLQEYSFDVEHVAGKDNELPDLLSRYPTTENTGEISEERMFPPLLAQINIAGLFHETLAEQHRVRSIDQDKERLAEVLRRGPQNRQEEKFVETFILHEDALYKRRNDRKLLIVPPKMRQRIIAAHHEGNEHGHPGRDETVRRIERHFTWNKIRKHVGDYIRKCVTCTTIKPRQLQEKAPMRANLPGTPFETISLDILGPYPESRRKNKFVIMAEDTFSKWVEARPVPRATTQELIEFFDEKIIARYGPPVSVISDNGAVFRSDRFQAHLEKHHITQKLTGIEHQRANPVERRVQEFKKIMRLLNLDRPTNEWDQHIAKTLAIMRGRKNRATGETPNRIVLGFEVPLPGEWEIPQYRQERRELERVPWAEVRERQRQFANEYHRPDEEPPVNFQVGDRVMLKNQGSRFEAAWLGPYPVLRKISPVLYEVEGNGRVSTVHVDKLRPVPAGNDPDRILYDDDEQPDDDLQPPAAEPQPRQIDVGGGQAGEPQSDLSMPRSERQIDVDDPRRVPGTSDTAKSASSTQQPPHQIGETSAERRRQSNNARPPQDAVHAAEIPHRTDQIDRQGPHTASTPTPGCSKSTDQPFIKSQTFYSAQPETSQGSNRPTQASREPPVRRRRRVRLVVRDRPTADERTAATSSAGKCANKNLHRHV